MKRVLAWLAVLTIVGSGCSATGDNVASDSSPSIQETSPRLTIPTTRRSTTTRTTTPRPPPPPFTVRCFPQSGLGQPALMFTSLEQAWAAAQPFSSCSTDMLSSYVPTPNDLVAVTAYQVFVPSEQPISALEIMLSICANAMASLDDVLRWQPTVMAGATLLCPTAPHIALMTQRANGDILTSGNYVVGTTIKPGVWMTQPGVRDCYWERLTGGGGILDNDFVTFATDGVTVTIRSSDGGFSAQNCGFWTRVG